MKPATKFKKRLEKAKWYTYVDEDSGRVVTNCYEHELEAVEKITDMKCEVVGEPDGFLVRISYVEKG